MKFENNNFQGLNIYEVSLIYYRSFIDDIYVFKICISY